MSDGRAYEIDLWQGLTRPTGSGALESVHTSAGDVWLYFGALAASVPVFARLGLYRAVVRFIGARVLLAVLAGVTVSVGLLLFVNELLLGQGVHISTFAIYWALALIYVGGSRLLARALIQVRRAGTHRVAFSFRPAYLSRGLVGSAVFLLIALAWPLAARRTP